MPIKVVFFGSFQHYSAITLDLIRPHFDIVGVITTPDSPVFEYAKNHNLNLNPPFSTPDFVVVAGYGQLLDEKWLNMPKIMAVNVHQSLLPEYAGRFPAEWAILRGETKTGVTMIKMSSKFDQGEIITQKSLPILPSDTKETLYKKLYILSGEIIIDTLPKIVRGEYKLTPQTSKGFYARQLTRDDGFVSNFADLDLKVRALTPWPSVWTYVTNQNGQKLMMKILSSANNTPLEVQIEGKKPAQWSQILSYYRLLS